VSAPGRPKREPSLGEAAAKRLEGRSSAAPGRPKHESSLGEAAAKRLEGRSSAAPGRPKHESSLGEAAAKRLEGRPVNMAGAVVLLDWPAPYVARLRINRPDKRNAIDYAVRQGLIDYLTQLQGDSGFRALVLGGVGGIFSAGGDIPSMVGLDPAGARTRMRHAHELCRLVAQLRVPVVSAFESASTGAAVGLALLGDEIIMGRGARVLFPFLRLGLAPDWGQLLSLPRRVGLPAARRLLTRDGPVLAAEAEQLGLADQVCDDDAVMTTAIERAEVLAALPALAYGQMKQRLNHPSATLAEEFDREEDDQAACLCGPDFREGYQAFREKRQPVFLPGRPART